MSKPKQPARKSRKPKPAAKRRSKAPARAKPAPRAKPARASAKPKPRSKPARASAKPKPKPKAKAKAKAKPSSKPAARTTPAATPKSLDQIDLMRMDGMRVTSHEQRDTAADDASQLPSYAQVRREVIALFRQFYPQEPPESDDTILATDPNDFDVDPSPFYEYLEQRFGVPTDPEQDYFGGYGGSVRDTIAFLAPRWNGKARGAERTPRPSAG